MKKQLGFTLIELMIVIAIIGILAAVAIPAYTDYLRRAKVAEPINLMMGLKTPAEEFYAANGAAPTLAAGDFGTSVTTKGKYTANIVDYAGGGVAGAIMGFQATLTDAALTLEPALAYAPDTVNANVNVWYCGSIGGAQTQYLPASCRHGM